MKFEQSGINTIAKDLGRIEEVMAKYQLVRDEHWDYQRITFDRKFIIEDVIYYLRIPGEAFEGDVGSKQAKVQLHEPLLGRHYYPHGVYYGNEEVFPEDLVVKCQVILMHLSESLTAA